MAIVLGLNCKLLRGTAGTTANTEMKNVKDVTCSLETGEPTSQLVPPRLARLLRHVEGGKH